MIRKLTSEETDKKEFHNARNEIYGWMREHNCSGRVDFYDDGGRVVVGIGRVKGDNVLVVELLENMPNFIGRFEIILFWPTKRGMKNGQS